MYNGPRLWMGAEWTENFEYIAIHSQLRPDVKFKMETPPNRIDMLEVQTGQMDETKTLVHKIKVDPGVEPFSTTEQNCVPQHREREWKFREFFNCISGMRQLNTTVQRVNLYTFESI